MSDAGRETGFGNFTLNDDPPSGFTNIGASTSWRIISGGADSEITAIQYALWNSGVEAGVTHLRRDAYPDAFDSIFSVKALVRVHTSNSVSRFVLGVNPDKDYDGNIYGAALDPYDGHLYIVKFTSLTSFSVISSVEFSYDGDKWYVVSLYFHGYWIEASIHEYGNESNEAHITDGWDSDYAFVIPRVRLIAKEEFDSKVSWLSDRTGEMATDPPASPGPEFDTTGYVEITWNWDLETYLINDDFLVEALTGETAEFDFPEYLIEGLTGYSGDVGFPETLIQASGWSAIGYGDVVFPDFFVGPFEHANGQIVLDPFDWVAYSGKTGGICSLEFPDTTVHGSGEIRTKSNGDLSFGIFTIQANGNHAAEVDFEKFSVEAESVKGIVADGDVFFSFSTAAHAVMDIISNADGGLASFPSFLISGQVIARSKGSGALEFPSFSLLGSDFKSLQAEAETNFPPFTIDSIVDFVHRGAGNVDFDFEVKSEVRSLAGFDILRFQRNEY